jgi:hypothetical protein
MSSTLEMLLEKVEDLSVQELLSLQERITSQLKIKVSSNGNGQVKQQPELPPDYIDIPGVYRLTPEEARKGLEEIFTPEELAEIDAADPNDLKLPPLPKSLAEMISEDREDRF